VGDDILEVVQGMLLQALEELPVDLMLPDQRRGERCMTPICTPFTSKMPKICSQIITLHGNDFVTGCYARRSSARMFYPQMKFSSKMWTNKRTKFARLVS
jgi:hypothetical protein